MGSRNKRQPLNSIPEFQGVRSRSRPGVARDQPKAQGQQPRSSGGQAGSDARTDKARQQTVRNRDLDVAEEHDGRTPVVGDALADPGALFEKLTMKLASQVDKAASKAGLKASQELSRKLTEELDDAIRVAMSTADKVGTLVRQAVQAAVDDTLRTAVLDATRVRDQQLAQLALIDRTAWGTDDIEAVRLRVDAEMKRAGLTRLTTPTNLTPFDVVDSEEHNHAASYEVLSPAYVETVTGRVVQRGAVRRLPADGTGESKGRG
ncbi:hypothetical protein [Streptomyces virginiae]|uniref:hypothetical protein n=1 Tax=Streptomyces virginiae TaxID=1961 RepID=UPI003250DB75